MTTTELIIPAHRPKAFLPFLVLLAIAASLWWLMQWALPTGWLAIALFGVAVLVSLSVLHPRGMYLRLDPDGLEMRAFSLKHKTRWRDIQSFEIKSLDARKMIAFNYRPDYHGQRTLRTLERSLGRTHGAILDQYQVPLADLERTLNEWRERYGRVDA